MIYALDRFLLLVFQVWLAVIFHAFALYMVWKGIQAINLVNKLEMNGPIEIPSEMIKQSRTQVK